MLNLSYLGLSIEKNNNPLDWESRTLIGISQLRKLNTFVTSREKSKANEVILIKNARNLVSIKII